MRELKKQFFGALLVILTMALVIAAAVNFQQQKKFRIPEDGVTWVERFEKPLQPNAAPRPAVVAYHVQPGSPAERLASAKATFSAASIPPASIPQPKSLVF